MRQMSSLRQAAAAPLPSGAFLRRDRGDALFVTNAPALRPDVDWAQVLAQAGFDCRPAGSLLKLLPAPALIIRLEAESPEPPDFFARTLARYRGLPPEEAALALLAQGLKVLDGGPDDGCFARALRRRAALCLRLDGTPRGPAFPDPAAPHAAHPRPTGGGLYACALVYHQIKGTSKNDRVGRRDEF